MTELRVTHVEGWDQRCEALVSEKVREQLQERGPALEVLNERSDECLLVQAPDGAPLLFLGFLPLTLLGGEVYVWMIAFRTPKLCYLKEMKRLFAAHAQRYTRVTAQILHTERQNRRWLEFFGFQALFQVNGLVEYERRG